MLIEQAREFRQRVVSLEERVNELIEERDANGQTEQGSAHPQRPSRSRSRSRARSAERQPLGSTKDAEKLRLIVSQTPPTL